jgi:hypothetical protein
MSFLVNICIMIFHIVAICVTMLELKDEGRSMSHWACQNLMSGKRAAGTARLRVSRDKFYLSLI